MSQKEQLAKLWKRWEKDQALEARDLLEAAFLLGARAMQEKGIGAILAKNDPEPSGDQWDKGFATGLKGAAVAVKNLKPEELLSEHSEATKL